jgi:MFS family permease
MCVTIGVQSGVRIAFGVFYVTLRETFGWSAASTAGVFSIYMLVQAGCSPLVGWCLDRYGPRRLFPLAALFVGISLALCSTIQTLPQFFLTYGVLLPIGQTALTAAPVSVVLARWFPDMRGRAIALADMGAALGLGLYPLFSHYLIVTYGWRWAFIGLAISVVLLVAPLTCWLRPVPTEVSRVPTADRSQNPALAHTTGQVRDPWTLRQAVRSLPFWMLFGTLLFSNLSSQILNVHLMALLLSVGVLAGAAARAVGMVNLVSLGGRLAIGWLADHLGRSQAYTMALLCSMLGMAILLGISSANASWVVVLFVGVFGLSKGSGGIVIASKAADVFHGERLGKIYGLITMASGLGGALGPWWAGWLVDRTGSYTPAIVASMIMASIAMTCMWLVERPQRAGSVLSARQ